MTRSVDGSAMGNLGSILNKEGSFATFHDGPTI